jgi:hypothetical protein
MASLDDILTTQKNGVQAINAYVSAINLHAGTVNTKKISASTTYLVKSSSGWLANVSIITVGDTITFYDTNSVSNTTGNEIAVISATNLGVIQIQVPFATGLVMKTGTGTAAATYT